MSLEQIKALIEQNKDNSEVSAYLQGLNPLTVEGVQKFINDNKDAKSWLDSIKDSHFNKALETYKKNNWEKELDAEIKKRFPEKDEREIELEKIKAQLQQMENEKQMETIRNKTIKLANEKKIPLDMVDFLVDSNESKTIENLNKLEGILNNHIQAAIQERLKNNSYTPPGDGDKKNTTSSNFLDVIKQNQTRK